MSDVTVIGLGAMGASLATCLLNTRSVTVWNRSPEKAAALEQIGAHISPTVQEAIAASPVTLICVSDYAVASGLFADECIQQNLHGRTIIQLSTGTPRDAVEGQAFFAKCGASYLDGAIEAYPNGIGLPSSMILIAGEKAAFERVEPIVRELAGASRYLGQNVRAPAALDLAWLSRLEGLIMGTLHGARICEAEGIPLSELIPMMPEGDRAQSLLGTIESNDFVAGANAATISVAAGVISRLQEQALDAGINSEFPDLMMTWFNRATEMGCSELDTAAVICALRGIVENDSAKELIYGKHIA